MDIHEKIDDTAIAWYEEGVAHRKANRLGEARNCFLKALEITPGYKQASVALEMIDDIQGFGNTDLYNV